MLYKYDLKELKYTRHDISKLKKTHYLSPSSCDLLNGTIFITGGLANAEDTDPVGNSYTMEGYQSKVTHAESMITPRYKHELVF